MADFEPQAVVAEAEVPDLAPLEDLAAALIPVFAEVMRQHWPHGPAWTTDPTSDTYRMLTAIAAAVADVEMQLGAFRIECDPTRTSQLIAEWERSLGLPDPCLGPSPNIEARRASVVAKLSNIQGWTSAEIVAFLAGLGYAVTLSTYQPFKAGSGQAGQLVLGAQWQFALAITYWGAGDRDRLRCALNHRVPAHVALVFYFGELTPQEMASDAEVPELGQIV